MLLSSDQQSPNLHYIFNPTTRDRFETRQLHESQAQHLIYLQVKHHHSRICKEIFINKLIQHVSQILPSHLIRTLYPPQSYHVSPHRPSF